MKTWLANLHWTKRLLFSFIALVFPWVDIATTDYQEPASDIAIMLVLTALAVYWVCKPFISRSSEGGQ